MSKLHPIAYLLLVLWTHQTIADEPLSESVHASVQALCNTMKACTFAQVESEKPVSAAMKKMVEQMSEEACQAMHSSFTAMPDDKLLKEQAQACLDSMSSLSCSGLEALGSGTTPACEAFEKRTKTYQ